MGCIPARSRPFPTVNGDRIAEADHPATDLTIFSGLVNLQVFAADDAGLFQRTATTEACEVWPPREVSSPSAMEISLISSGTVS